MKVVSRSAASHRQHMAFLSSQPFWSRNASPRRSSLWPFALALPELPELMGKGPCSSVTLEEVAQGAGGVAKAPFTPAQDARDLCFSHASLTDIAIKKTDARNI